MIFIILFCFVFSSRSLPFVSQRARLEMAASGFHTVKESPFSVIRTPLPKIQNHNQFYREYDGPFYCNGTCISGPSGPIVTCPPDVICVVSGPSGPLPPVICDDHDPCTTASCNITEGCIYTPILDCCAETTPCLLPGQICICNECRNECDAFHMTCDDNDPCTTDTCVAGECIHTVISCDDSNPATVDFCSAGSCIHVFVPLYCTGPGNTSLCEDRGCTTVACINNRCTYTPVFNCCTSDVDCFVHLSATDPEDNQCTTSFCHSTCVGGCHTECRYDLVQCLAGEGIGDICTTEQCVPSIGSCVAIEDPCDDHNECTEDFCAAICDQSCCRHDPIPLDGQPCDGGSGTCDNGDCVPLCEDVVCEARQCSNVFCDSTTGNCTRVASDDCEDCVPDPEVPDNVCRPVGTCECGECVPGPYVDCDDSNPCTNDFLNVNATIFADCCIHVLYECNDPESVPADCCCINCSISGPAYPDCAIEIDPSEYEPDFCPPVPDVCHINSCLIDGSCVVLFNSQQPGCCNITADCTDTPPPCNQYICNNTFCVLIPTADGGVCLDDEWVCTTNGTCWNGQCVETEFTPAPECCDDDHLCDNSPGQNPPCKTQFCFENECILTYYNNEADCCTCDADCQNALQPPLLVAASVPLGAGLTFGILADNYTNLSPFTLITGFGADLGFATDAGPAPVVGGDVHNGDATYLQAGVDQAAASVILDAAACSFVFLPGDIDVANDVTHGPAGLYTAGVYCIDGDILINGTVTIDGVGVVVFRSTGGINTIFGSSIGFINDASVCNLFWTPNNDSFFDAESSFAGTVVTEYNVELGIGMTVLGRFLAFNGNVTTQANTITVPDCQAELLADPECFRRSCNPDTNQCFAEMKPLAPCLLPEDDGSCMLYGQCSSLSTCEPNPWFFNDTKRPGCCQFINQSLSGPYDFEWEHTTATPCTLDDVQSPPFDPEDPFQRRCYEAFCDPETHQCEAEYVGGECGCCQTDADCTCEPCIDCQISVCNLLTSRCERAWLPPNSTCLPSRNPCFGYGLCVGPDINDRLQCVPAGENECDDHNECTCDTCVTNFNNETLFESVGCTHTPIRDGEPCSMADYEQDECLRVGFCNDGFCVPSVLTIPEFTSGPLAAGCASFTCQHGVVEGAFNQSEACPCDPDAESPCGAPIYPECQIVECQCITCQNHIQLVEPVYRCVIVPINFDGFCNSSIHTGDRCFEQGRCSVGGECVAQPLHLPILDDGNQCTLDYCDPNTGEYNTTVYNGTCCDDGFECTVDDFCDNGECVGGGPKQCPLNPLDPGGLCLVPTCFEGGGCGWSPAPMFTLCTPPFTLPDEQFCFFCNATNQCQNLCNPDWQPASTIFGTITAAATSTTFATSTTLNSVLTSLGITISSGSSGQFVSTAVASLAASTTTLGAPATTAATGSGSSGLIDTGATTVIASVEASIAASTATEAGLTIGSGTGSGLTTTADADAAAVSSVVASLTTSVESSTAFASTTAGDGLTTSVASTLAADTTGTGGRRRRTLHPMEVSEAIVSHRSSIHKEITPPATATKKHHTKEIHKSRTSTSDDSLTTGQIWAIVLGCIAGFIFIVIVVWAIISCNRSSSDSRPQRVENTAAKNPNLFEDHSNERVNTSASTLRNRNSHSTSIFG